MSHFQKKKKTHAQQTREDFQAKDESLKFTFCGRGSLFCSSAASLLAAAGLLVVAGFFFAVVGLAAGVGPADSSSLSAVTSGLTTVAPTGFFVIVAELTDGAADLGTAAVLEDVVADAVERGSPRRLSKTAFSAYSLIYTKKKFLSK
jgi:hypothetical protein